MVDKCLISHYVVHSYDTLDLNVACNVFIGCLFIVISYKLILEAMKL